MTDAARPWLSVVIPAYNESSRLGRGLEQVRDYAGRARGPIEVIVVDDGSRDDTSGVAERFAPGPLTLRVLRNERNRGKGWSVRRGMLQAAGGLVLMSDADFSAHIGEVEKLLQWAEAGFDVVIGSRDMPDSVLAPAQPWRRRWSARAFRTLRRHLVVGDLRDTQCGFKLFGREASRAVFSRLRVSNFAFDIEALVLARRLGLRIREVGVVWCNDPASRVRPVIDPLRMIVSLAGIAWRTRRPMPDPAGS